MNANIQVLARETAKLLKKRPGLVDAYKNGNFGSAYKIETDAQLNECFRSDIFSYVVRESKKLDRGMFADMSKSEIVSVMSRCVPALTRCF